MPNDGAGELFVYAPVEANTFRLNDGVTLALENRSAHEILFLPENALKVYLKEGDTWTEIGNLVSNPIPRKIILSSSDVVDSNATVVWVIPDVLQSSPAVIRVDILGTDQTTHQEIKVSTVVSLKP